MVEIWERGKNDWSKIIQNFNGAVMGGGKFLGDGVPKKKDLTATICTLIPVVYTVICDVTNTHPY